MLTDALSPLRIFARSFLLLVLAVLGTPPTILCINRFGASIRVGRQSLEEFMMKWWCGSVCRLIGVRVTLKGKVEAPPVLVVANHISWLDILVLHSQAVMGFVSKAEIARWPVVGFLARISRVVFHERGSHDSASNVAEAMTQSLKQDRRVAIFPEGGIHPGDEVKVFHARLFKAAVDVPCPVQPVMIRYQDKGARVPEMRFGRESFLINFFRILGRPTSECEVHFLAPLDARDRPRRELANAAQAVVAEAYEEVR